MDVLSALPRTVAIRAVAALALLVWAATPALAQRGLAEYEVKAAFLFNFMKFVEWPGDDKWSELTLCIAGRDPVRAALETIANGKQANGRQVVVRELADDGDPRTCHVVFLGAADPKRHSAILQRVQHSAVLTVGETPHFLTDGGLVRFYVEANRVRFAIDPSAAQRVGLKISSQLLSLSKMGG